MKPTYNPGPSWMAALKIAIVYAIIGALWILTSDWILRAFVEDPVLVARIELVKGWFYVLTTAIVLGFWLNRYFRRIRKATDLLVKSESRFTSIFNHHLEAVAISRLRDRVFIDVNEAFTRQSGYTREEILGHTAEELNLWYSSNQHIVLEELKEKRSLVFEMQARHKNGSIRDQLVSAQVIELEGEDCLLVTLVDITSRKEAEKALKESEEKFRTTFMTAPDAISINRLRDGMYIAISPSFTNIMGFEESEVLGKTSLELHIWDDPENRHLFVSALQNESIVRNFDALFRKKDGTLINGLVSATRMRIGEELYILSFTRDNTERRRAEEAVRQSEQRLNFALSASHTGAWSLDLENKTATRSLIHAQIFGYESLEDDWDMDRFLSHIIPEDKAKVSRILMAGISAKSGWSFECRILRRDGAMRWIFVAGGPEKHEQSTRVSGIVQDITDIKQAENEIHHLNQELEQLNASLELKVKERTALLEDANKELEAFSYSVSHDLRAPLRHINGYVDLLKQSLSNHPDEEIRHFLDTISAASGQMGALIDALLDFSRTGRKEPSKMLLDFSVLVRDIIDEMMPSLTGREISWNIQQLPQALGDPTLIRLVWTNLLDNAVKYTRNKQPAHIEVGCTKESSAFIFYVKDNGVGFDMKYKHKLFGVFQRLHSQTEFEGTGIGLANVQRIIHKHGGKVWAEATPGEGATFYFSLPD